MHALGPKTYDGLSCPSVEQASRCKTISQAVFVLRLAHGKVGVCYTNEFLPNSVMFPLKYWSPHARSPKLCCIASVGRFFLGLVTHAILGSVVCDLSAVGVIEKRMP